MIEHNEEKCQMELYILDRKGERGYDQNEAIVVRAISPKQARQIANDNCGDEGGKVWLSPKDSTCKVLSRHGKIGKIIVAFNAA